MQYTPSHSRDEARTILITGATGGLGQALCETFAYRDYGRERQDPARHRIAIHTHQALDAAEKLSQQLQEQGCDTLVLQADLSKQAAVEQLFQSLRKKWAKLDLLINNAGITLSKLFRETEDVDWDKLFEVNLKTAFFCMQAAAKNMLPHKQGHIINIASHAAFLGRRGQAAYAASKQALLSLTVSAAGEWGSEGLQVNAICPGFLPTGMTKDLNAQQKSALLQDTLLQRFSSLEEIAQFILHLSEMKHVSGQVFKLDSRLT